MTKEMIRQIENDYWEEKADPIDMTEVFDLASKALEQQPCEDCISILNRIMEYTYGMLTTEKFGLQHLIKSMIDDLPSVTPQPRTGHWIDIMVGDMQAQSCDQCKTFYPLAYTGGGHRFCPNCGAKMEGEE